MPSHVLQVACLQCSASAPASQYLVPWQYQEVNLLAQFLPMSFMLAAIFSHCFNDGIHPDCFYNSVSGLQSRRPPLCALCACSMASNENAPVGAGMEKILLRNLDLSTAWTELDGSTLKELEDAFRGGSFGQTVLATPSVIAINGVAKAGQSLFVVINLLAATAQKILSLLYIVGFAPVRIYPICPHDSVNV